MQFWPPFRDAIQDAMSLDREWTVDEPNSLTWWGWHFPQRVEYLDEPGGELGYIVGRVRISTVIGQVAPEARVYVAGILNDWNQDATGAIGLMDPDTGVVHLGVAVPVTETNYPLAAQLAAGFMPRQAAYATHLARYLHSQGLVDSQHVAVTRNPHPQFGIRENPDELVTLYIEGVRDGVSLDAYDNDAVHEKASLQLQQALPFEPGFTNIDQGVRNFQSKSDANEWVGYQCGEHTAGGIVAVGPLLHVRANTLNAAAIANGDNPAQASAIFLTHANWHTWNEPRMPMLGAWMPGMQVNGDYTMATVSALIPPASLPREINTSPTDRATILQNLLVYVYHQANAAAPLTFRVYG